MREINFKDVKKFISFYVDVFQLLNLPVNMRVKGRLREFLVNQVVMFHEGWDLNSAEGVKEISARMGFTTRDEVYNYRLKLKKQGLFQQTKEGLVLPPGLSLSKIPERMIFQFKVINEFE